MKTKNRYRLLVVSIILCSICIYSCIKGFDSEYENNDDKTIVDSNASSKESVVTIGKKLENPYSIANMHKAYASLAGSTRSTFSEDIIQPTDLYIKFTPNDENEYDRLRDACRDIEFYNTPLDCEQIGEGVYYPENLQPDDIPPLYAAVPVGRQLPDVSYTILEYLFIPEHAGMVEQEDATRAGGDDLSNFLSKLEDVSLKLTGNDTEPSGGGGTRSSSYCPVARISIWDDVTKSLIPLENARVRIRRWFTTHAAYTNSAGCAYFNYSYTRPVNFCIVWENHTSSGTWDIRSSLIGQAIYNGPKQKGTWTLDLYPDPEAHISWRLATIHRGMNRFFFKNICGLNRCTGNTVVRYSHENGTGQNNDVGLGGIFPNIRIWGFENNKAKTSDKLLNTLFHELGHRIHKQSNGEIFNLYYSFIASKLIVESWADYVGWVVVSQEYRERNVLHRLSGYTGDNTRPITIVTGYYYTNEYTEPIYSTIPTPIITNPDDYNDQGWTQAKSQPEYSPLFIDLADDFNQREYYYGDTNYPNDKLSGLSPATIQQMVFSLSSVGQTYSISVIKNKVLSLNRFHSQDVNDFFELYLPIDN